MRKSSELRIKDSELGVARSGKGVGLIEILIVLAILAIGFLAIITFVLFSRGVNFLANRTTFATSLAEEGVEAVRRLRDQSWGTNIVPLVSSATYYLVLDGGNWELTTTNPGTIDNLYTRTVRFDDAYRDSNDNIASSGAPDQDTRKLTVTVSWSERAGVNKQVVLTTYVTNFLGN